ncbi:uncharacterized protein MONOS_451 [Monocercomonoides exilis]|uniref:uncharacterized protein n=1 Tax=Monocercomonoides exilis TaxID=2049356 RepID=UPI00355992D3|nr:hypothetical protein MONOS_451 [Monocercomonoides exilis]|eukprot:MONOS_451.1-p1 / transcript=MONOS_451.1 / gene=MONOS_451 / organism=Monocercomonoides_exilis_PA203 / gene_product=unspecified product / transcript_product=unspecified product / location=Mono_scaffold00007:131506-131845(+) / protein_length=95 / sequence_SO=supercontig / SO=protein_coding / is_pseudo=false
MLRQKEEQVRSFFVSDSALSQEGEAVEAEQELQDVPDGVYIVRRTVLFLKAWEEIGGGDLVRNGIQAMWKSRREREKLSKMLYRDGVERTSEEH